jgi:hypothetical protein
MDIKKEHVVATATWARGFFILLFALIYTVAEAVLWLMVIVQFGFKLLTGKANLRLLEFSQRLSVFIYQILLYITFNSESKPFPFSDWPSAVPKESLLEEVNIRR